MFQEIAGDSADDDLIVLHDALDFGHCHLALGVPMGGRFAGVDSLEQLKVTNKQHVFMLTRQRNWLLAFPPACHGC